jgi:hypothetical protein
MTRLEDRLRAALDELAATVPPSANAVAEHNRRVAATESRRRRPMLAAAAAAVVIAGVVAPSALSHGGRESTVDDGMNAVAPPHTATVSTPTGGAPGLDEPYQAQVEEEKELANFTEAGKNWTAFAFVERTATSSGWGYRLCVLAVPTGEPVNSPVRHPNSTGCTPAHDWPAGQPPSKVETRSVLGANRPASGPLPGLLLFVTAPEVARLAVRAGDGRPVAVRQLMRIPELVVFLADFGTSYEGFGYDARDAAGNIVESGIT